MSEEAKAVARVRVTLEIPIASLWGTGCTIEQVYKQAMDAARGILRRHFYLGDGLVAGGGGGCDRNEETKITLVSMEPIAVITEDKRR